MKKILALVLSLVLVLSFAACGQKEEPAKQPDTGTTTTQPEKKTDAPAPPAPVATDEPIVPEDESGVKLEMVNDAFGEFARYTTPHTEDMTVVDKTTLWIGQSNIIQSGNPHSGSNSPVYDLVFDRLIEYDLDTGKLTGVIFKDWEMADDCSYLTFNMYDNITFHTGEKATAEDVFYTLKRCADPSLASLADKAIFTNIDFDKSEITGEFSGKIVLKTPSITFLPGLTKCFLLSKNYIEEQGEDNAWWANTVGTGAYTVEQIAEFDRYVLKRNDNYWTGEKGPFENIVIRFFAEAATMFMDYETHNIDMVIAPSSSDVERVIAGEVDNTVLELRSTLATYSIVFNEEKGNPALSDVNVRKAIALAIDAETVDALAYQRLGAVGSSIIPMALSDSVPMAYEQDIDAAKAALKEAGYKAGEIELTIGTGNRGGHKNAAESMQAMLEEVGFKVNLVVADGSVNIQNMRNAGPDVYDLSITNQSFDTLESANFLGAISHACGSASFTGATDDKVDEIALRAQAAKTTAEKEECMRELQNYLHDNYWTVPLCEEKGVIVYRDYLSGIRCLIPTTPDYMKLEIVG